MNKEDKFVITISRQFGTGGHEIGAELARDTERGGLADGSR